MSISMTLRELHYNQPAGTNFDKSEVEWRKKLADAIDEVERLEYALPLLRGVLRELAEGDYDRSVRQIANRALRAGDGS